MRSNAGERRHNSVIAYPVIAYPAALSWGGFQLPLEVAQCLHREQALRETGIRFAAVANGGEKFAILQFDAVHRDADLRHIDGVVFAVQQFIVARDVRAVIADVAEKSAQGAVMLKDSDRV